MSKYNYGKIYRLVNEELNMVYYGSTTQTLSKRYYQHKMDSSNPNKTNTSRKLFSTNSVPFIELLELVNCNSKYDLETIERQYIENNSPVLYECVNKVIPLRTTKEYYIDNCELIKQKFRDYYALNKDAICQKKKEYYYENKETLLKKFDCPCGGTFTPKHRLRHLKSVKHQKFIDNN